MGRLLGRGLGAMTPASRVAGSMREVMGVSLDPVNLCPRCNSEIPKKNHFVIFSFFFSFLFFSPFGENPNSSR